MNCNNTAKDDDNSNCSDGGGIVPISVKLEAIKSSCASRTCRVEAARGEELVYLQIANKLQLVEELL